MRGPAYLAARCGESKHPPITFGGGAQTRLSGARRGGLAVATTAAFVLLQAPLVGDSTWQHADEQFYTDAAVRMLADARPHGAAYRGRHAALPQAAAHLLDDRRELSRMRAAAGATRTDGFHRRDQPTRNRVHSG
jgi:hypothetical protein